MRAAATIGGNLCAPAGHEPQRGDLGAPLIALGARVRSTGKGGERTEPVEDFLAGERAGRLVLEIEYDRPAGAWSAQTLRRRHAHSYAIANVAICSSGDGLRVGVVRRRPDGGALPRGRAEPQRRRRAEGRRPGRRRRRLGRYRRKMLVVLVRRALDELESS